MIFVLVVIAFIVGAVVGFGIACWGFAYNQRQQIIKEATETLAEIQSMPKPRRRPRGGGTIELTL